MNLSNLLDSVSWDPLVGVTVLLGGSSSLSFVCSDTESVTLVSDSLVGKVLGLSHDFHIIEILVLSATLEKLDELVVVSLHVVEFNVDRTFALT